MLLHKDSMLSNSSQTKSLGQGGTQTTSVLTPGRPFAKKRKLMEYGFPFTRDGRPIHLQMMGFCSFGKTSISLVI